VAVLALTAAGLYVSQILVGAALVWSRLSAPARVAHVAVAGLIWGALVAAAATARVAPAGEPPDHQAQAGAKREAA
jgi:heme A synthase